MVPCEPPNRMDKQTECFSSSLFFMVSLMIQDVAILISVLITHYQKNISMQVLWIWRWTVALEKFWDRSSIILYFWQSLAPGAFRIEMGSVPKDQVWIPGVGKPVVIVEYKICLLKHKTTHRNTLSHKRYCYIELANKFIWVFCNIFMEKLNWTFWPTQYTSHEEMVLGSNRYIQWPWIKNFSGNSFCKS